MATSEKISQEIEKICAQTGIPYIDVLCHREGKQIFRYIYGENATGKEQLQMYSCSKPVTAIAAMILIERGQLSIGDKVEKYLPEIKNAFLLDGSGKKISPKNKMTIYHLLTMTAGFTYDIATPPILEVVKNNKEAKLRDFIRAFVSSPLSFEPGTSFLYSLCYDVLAAVIEVASGMQFSAFVQKNIFEPLKMTHSFFDNRALPFLQMYEADAKGNIHLSSGKNSLLPTAAYESGGAGLVSTVEDYSLFARMLANEGANAAGERIVSSDCLKQMASEQIGEMSLNNQFTCIQGDDYGYGFGVRVRKNRTNWGLSKGEFGWDGAAGSYLMVDPVHKISIVIGMHVMSWPYIFTGKHLEIVRLIYENCFQDCIEK